MFSYFVIGYSVFEIQYLAGGEFGKQFLEQINPYIHVIKVEHDWWPPLLWPDKQLRSVFQNHHIWETMQLYCFRYFGFIF